MTLYLSALAPRDNQVMFPRSTSNKATEFTCSPLISSVSSTELPSAWGSEETEIYGMPKMTIIIGIELLGKLT